MDNWAGAGRVYALAVGIDAYARVPLAGCVNDVDALARWLHTRIPADRLFTRRLVNEEATRASVSAAFRSHLGQARAGDVALFHFAGHGRRSTQAAAFNQFDPGGKEEGLMLWDSQGPRDFDLADKELALLIDDVAAGGADIVLITDCCHSGTLTRDADDYGGFTVRAMPERGVGENQYFRDLKDYADGRYQAMQDAGGLFVPAARHMLLAACTRTQKAKERGGHGVFTTALLRVLDATGGALSYAELFQQVRAAVRQEVAEQDPQFEAIGGFDAWSGVLGNAVTSTPARFELAMRDGSWQLAAGAVHGLVTDPGRPAVVQVLDGDAAVGTARLLRIGAQTSLVEPDFAADPARRYRASLISLPAPALAIACALPPADADAVARAIADDPACGVVLAAADAATAQRLVRNGAAVQLLDTASGERLWAVADEGDWTAPLVGALKAIAKWTRLAALATPPRQPGVRQLDPARFEARLLQTSIDGPATQLPPNMRFSVGWDAENGRWHKVRLGMQLRHDLGQTLYAALFLFNDDFGIMCLDNREQPPGSEFTFAWGADGRRCRFGPNPWQQHTTMRLKLIVSTEPLDGFLLEQDGVAMPPDQPPQLATRGAVGDDDDVVPPVRADWFVQDFVLHIVGEQARLGPQPASLADGAITISGHKAITGTAALVAPAAPTRDAVGGDGPVLAMARAGLALAGFAGATRSSEGAAVAGGVLDLGNLAGLDQMDGAPLMITARPALAAGEMLVPLLFDGDDLVPPALVETDGSGATTIRIDQLPAPATRSFGNALKLYFFKSVLGDTSVNRLRWVDCSGAAPVYGADDLAARVGAARRVLLIVHGIIGDTHRIAEGLIATGIWRAFDLVLAWDYESLNTPIDANAAALKAQLQLAGLGSGDGRHLTILAHSMGGLVARALIEQQGGAAMADHLVMCGTPNGGSPFGRIDTARALFTLLLGVAGNKLPWLLPQTAAALYALNKSRDLTVALEQMKPQSPFLTGLGAAADPGVRYTILAGDIDAVTAAGDTLVRRLLVKMGQSALFDRLFAAQPHDLCVAVPSIAAVPGARQPVPATGAALACHHLDYFTSPAGLAALKGVAWQA